MQKIDLKCPQCGANLLLNEEKDRLHCEYCGYSSLVSKKESPEEAARRLEKLSYAKERAQLRAREESIKARTKGCLRTFIIVICFFFYSPSLRINTIDGLSRKRIPLN